MEIYKALMQKCCD